MEEHNFYQSVVEHTPVGYSYNKILYDEEGNPFDYRLIKVNKAYESMLGIKGETWIGKKVSELYQAIGKQSISWQEFHKKVTAKSKKIKFVKKITYLGKHYRIKIHSPKKGYIIISLTDITQELGEAEKFRMLFDHVPIQVWYLKDPSTYISANKEHAVFLGFKSDELVNWNLTEMKDRERAEICIEGNQKVFLEKKQVVTKEWLNNSQDEKRLLRITKTPELNSKGKIEFVICSAEDITADYISKEQQKIQERILYASMDFTQELLTNKNLSEALSNGIEMLGEATQVDRVYYWENHYDEDSQKWFTSQKIEWFLENTESKIDNPAFQNISFNKAGGFIKTLAKNEPFNCHTKDIEEKDMRTKTFLEDEGILSILTIPVFLKNEFIGFIGFDSYQFEKKWTDVEISLLKSFVLLYEKAMEKNQLKKQLKQKNNNFFNFFNMIEDLLIVLDLEGKILDINNNVLERLNYSREELLGEHFLIFHPKNEQEQAKRNFTDIIMKKEDYFKISAVTKEGDTFPIETTNSMGIWNGEPVIFAVVKDVSELALSEDKFSKAFNNSGVSIFISRFEDGKILDVNEKFLNYMGYTAEEVLGKTTLELNMTHSYENRNTFKEQIKVDNKISDLEIEFVTKDNVIQTGLTNIVPITINGVECLLSSIIDISDRIKNEKKILALSNRDALTNIYNRRFIYKNLEEKIENYSEKKKSFSVAILDLDNFKEINDGYGHQVGDCILIDFSKVIKENLRKDDILGRYGGEEFIIILEDIDIEESYKLLKRVLRNVRSKLFMCGGNPIELTFSAGIVSSEELKPDELSIDHLVGISDKRMYSAKENGRNQIVSKK